MQLKMDDLHASLQREKWNCEKMKKELDEAHVNLAGFEGKEKCLEEVLYYIRLFEIGRRDRVEMEEGKEMIAGDI